MAHRILHRPSSDRSARAFFSSAIRSYSRFSSSGNPPDFGIAFDIDGVLMRDKTPIGGSVRALKRLFDDSGAFKVPFVFLTNGGGIRESKRATELSEILGVNILPSQVLQGHAPFKQLVNRFEDDFVIAVGKGEPAAVLCDYGFKNVISIDDYVSCFDNIDPLARYKNWRVKEMTTDDQMRVSNRKEFVRSHRVQAAFVVSDSVDWSRDVQVLCDILRTGGLPGGEVVFGDQPPLYFSHDDLKYQAMFPTERFGLGAFRIALQSIYNSIHPHPLQYTCVGKPNPGAFKNAEKVLKQHCSSNLLKGSDYVSPFRTLYMIGDNPSVDINGAGQAGHPWFSILTRTGVFRGTGNDSEFPADKVVDTVEEAVHFIMEKEGSIPS